MRGNDEITKYKERLAEVLRCSCDVELTYKWHVLGKKKTELSATFPSLPPLLSEFAFCCCDKRNVQKQCGHEKVLFQLKGCSPS